MPARRDYRNHIHQEPPDATLADILNLVIPDWTADALCAQTDPEAFFPEKGGTTAPAKAMCRSCPVQTECLDYALTEGERHGIWGGLSERERRPLEKANRPRRSPRGPTHYRRSDTDQLIADHDLTTADIRAWATANNITVRPSGRLSLALVTNYLEHHPTTKE